MTRFALLVYVGLFVVNAVIGNYALATLAFVAILLGHAVLLGDAANGGAR